MNIPKKSHNIHNKQQTMVIQIIEIPIKMLKPNAQILNKLRATQMNIRELLNQASEIIHNIWEIIRKTIES